MRPLERSLSRLQRMASDFDFLRRIRFRLHFLVGSIFSTCVIPISVGRERLARKALRMLEPLTAPRTHATRGEGVPHVPANWETLPKRKSVGGPPALRTVDLDVHRPPCQRGSWLAADPLPFLDRRRIAADASLPRLPSVSASQNSNAAAQRSTLNAVLKLVLGGPKIMGVCDTSISDDRAALSNRELCSSRQRSVVNARVVHKLKHDSV